MKFASFETVVEMIYHRLPGKKDDYGKGAQTAVSFAGGYIAGILCAIVSHPADVMVSKLNAVRKPGEAFGAAMGRIYSEIGFKGLWNGLPVRIIMIGTLTGMQWCIYGKFIVFVEHSTTLALVILTLEILRKICTQLKPEATILLLEYTWRFIYRP
jgi:solute carrier family 25 phosphate transporter 3